MLSVSPSASASFLLYENAAGLNQFNAFDHWASCPYALANGRCFQIFCIVGDFSHEGLATVVDTSLSGVPSAAETYNASW